MCPFGCSVMCPYHESNRRLGTTYGLLNKNLSPDWGERCLTRFHPDLYPEFEDTTRRTDNGVNHSPCSEGFEQVKDLSLQVKSYHWGSRSRVVFTGTTPKEISSLRSPLSGGHLPATRPGQRGIKIGEIILRFTRITRHGTLVSLSSTKCSHSKCNSLRAVRCSYIHAPKTVLASQCSQSPSQTSLPMLNSVRFT